MQRISPPTTRFLISSQAFTVRSFIYEFFMYHDCMLFLSSFLKYPAKIVLTFVGWHSRDVGFMEKDTSVSIESRFFGEFFGVYHKIINPSLKLNPIL